MPWYVILILLIIVGGAILLVVTGIRSSREDDPLQMRLLEFAERGEQVSLEEIELAQPFTERIIYPLARKMGEFALKFTPQNALIVTSQKIEIAGNPGRLDPTLFWALRLIAAVGFGGALLFVFTIAPGKQVWSRNLLIISSFTLLGFYLPELWLSGKISRRQSQIRKAMPDALDLLTICVDAGLGFDAAMSKVNEKWDNELSLEFGRVIREIQLGKLRKEAMRAMADRIGIPEMTSFVAAIIQSEQLGVSLAHVLRIQADQMRVMRRQAAEQMAQKAPVKMLIPMGLLIFPALCIVLMTPAFLMLMGSTIKGMF